MCLCCAQELLSIGGAAADAVFEVGFEGILAVNYSKIDVVPKIVLLNSTTDRLSSCGNKSEKSENPSVMSGSLLML